jgi:hypothetical protein
MQNFTVQNIINILYSNIGQYYGLFVHIKNSSTE